MTTYYVSESGDDTILVGSNSASTPFKSNNRALAECTLNDTVSFIGTSEIPCRSVIDATYLPAAATSVNINGNNGYQLGTVNISEGETFFADEIQQFCNDVSTWASVSNVADETTNMISGGGSLYCYNASANSQGAKSARWNGKVKIHVTFKNANAGNFKWRWENDTTAEYFRLSDDTWVAAAATNTEADTDQTAFITETLTSSTSGWIDPNVGGAAQTAGLYKFWIFTSSGEGVYIDQVRFQGICEWNTAGAEWYLDFPIALNYTPRVMKCTNTEWTANKQTALRNLTKGTVGALNAGEYGIDNAVGVQRVYYKPLAGESISDLHFETGRYLGNTIDQTCNIRNIAKVTGLVWGFDLSAGAPVIENVHCDRTQLRGFSSSGTSTPKAISCSVKNIQGDGASNHGEGFFSNDTSTFTIEGCHAENIDDDCYQPSGLSTMILRGCTGIQDSSGYSTGSVFESNFDQNQGASACGWEVSGCTFITNVNTLCMKIENDGTTAYNATCRDNIFMQNGTIAGPLQMASANVTLTKSNNTVTGSYSGAGADWLSESDAQSLINWGATEVATASVGLNTSTFSLSEDSTLIGTGTKWWTGANPTGADGEPFSDMQTDPGGIQSTYYALHPVNL